MIEPLPDEYFMREALRQAQKAYAAEEVPVGAVVVREGKIIGRAHNQVELLKDATAHAEMLALTQAEAAVGDWRLTDCDLYVTKEPCAMCAGAVVHTRIRRVIFGCADPSAGAAGSVMNLLQMPSLQSPVRNHVRCFAKRMRCDFAGFFSQTPRRASRALNMRLPFFACSNSLIVTSDNPRKLAPQNFTVAKIESSCA